jgi:hypothetical protein
MAKPKFAPGVPSSLTILVPVDPNDPCPTWQKMTRIAGQAGQSGEWRCERLGAQAPGGRTMVRYLATSPNGGKDFAWIDRGLKFPLKFEFADGSGIALRQIHPGPQPADLFAVPTDYRKFYPQQLIDRIKQSDVWVDPPK